MESKTVILTISLTVNFFLLGIVLILWFRKCRDCGKDKEISQIFSKHCQKCKDKEDKNGEKPKTSYSVKF